MTEVKIILAGEVWENSSEVIDKLYSISSTEPVVINTRAEGVSLGAVGVLEVLDRWVKDTGRSPDTVKINTPNHFEKTNYQFLHQRPSHFLLKPYISKYHVPLRDLVQSQYLFGFFVGNYRPIRNTIARDILTRYRQHFLISIMRFSTIPNSGPDQFWDPDIYEIGSIDNRQVEDQYKLDVPNTNYSLLQFYNQFEIELVSETFLYGQTFFPTEKTARPIVGCRPMLINGPINFLDNLKQLGFKTFDQLWPEEYDGYEGQTRWTQIKLTIDYIIKHGYDRNLANEIVRYNYNLLQDTISQK
jgi:hypothetical protein